MIIRILIALALLVAPSIARAELREGKRFTVMVEGKGPDVVLIPGLASPRDVWDGARKALGGKYRLHLVQVRGFGDDAGMNASGPVLEPLVKELADYIDDEIVGAKNKNGGGKPPAIVGHSMGGLAGMMIAARHPNLVGRLMVVDALPFIGALFMGPTATVAGMTPQAEQARATTLNTRPSATPVTTDPGGIWSMTAAGRIQIANWSRAADPRVVAQALYDDLLTDMRPELDKIVAKPFVVLYAAGIGPQITPLWTREFARIDGDAHPGAGQLSLHHDRPARGVRGRTDGVSSASATVTGTCKAKFRLRLKPFVLSLSKHRPSSSKEERPFDTLRANGGWVFSLSAIT